MPLFSRSSGGGGLFQKVKSGLGSVFGAVNRGATGLGSLAGKAGGILGTISSIAKNPIVSAIASGLGQGENLARFADATGKGQALAQKVSGVSQKVADISTPATYFNQNPVPAARNVLERAKNIAADVKMIGSSPFSLGPRFA